MFIHSAKPKLGFVLLMCALLGLSLLACVTSPAPTDPPPTPTELPPTPTSPPPTPTEPPTPVATNTPLRPTMVPSRTPAATPTKARTTTLPGSTIRFKDTLKAGGEDAFLVLGAAGNILQASVDPDSDLQVNLEFQKTDDKKALFSAKSGKTLLAMVPEIGLYRVVVRDAGKSGGDYHAVFTGTKGLAFSLDPKFLVTGYLPEDGTLTHIYTGRPGSTLTGVFLPDAKTDLVIKVYSMADLKNVLATINKAGIGKTETLVFTLPKSSNAADTYVITVSEQNGNAGQYVLAVKTEN
jgi:hypothetical protein